MQERRDKGLCYNCDEKFFIGHKCIKPRLYYLEGVESYEGEEQENNSDIKEEHTTEEGEDSIPSISLHAIAGALEPTTMRLKGVLNHKPVMILIDSGSTHNFIDAEAAKKTQLPISNSQLAVQIANGDKISCLGYCQNVKIHFNNFDSLIDLYVLNLGGCDVVLGIQWLRELGTIEWNFQNLTLQFQYKGQPILLQGLQPSPEFIEEKEHKIKIKQRSKKGLWIQLLAAEWQPEQPSDIPPIYFN